jgi:hypothetical protein
MGPLLGKGGVDPYRRWGKEAVRQTPSKRLYLPLHIANWGPLFTSPVCGGLFREPLS